ncbi:protein phosphatase 1 regulatory inhibitor subunit PPP1R8 homolog [Cucurbita moschata]|uniref:Protein phosphatase 1 regulatory inhibitor subunit PPP1R8 homolog n=1 Tax=Cucurbita moschata TaxID=3662 RepID=A0A6J1EGU4_CUCMO|nr:protein phosphatase 1 regulatory inhibitor subunit PPP1R8 homolog [Cucurbita moschata]
MYGRSGLDRFKKAQTLEPFSVTVNSTSHDSAQSSGKEGIQPLVQYSQSRSSHFQSIDQHQSHDSKKLTGPEAGPLVGQTQQSTQVGGSQSTWQPPDWAIEPRAGVYYLEVLKDGEVIDRINLDRRRHIFGRQFHTCDFVLDHQSVSRQHAAVIPHKNGSIYVIDLGSAHGTFVANERLTKDSPVELEAGQSLRFAASTRTYILRKNNAALFARPPLPTEFDLPPPPDPSDEEAVVSYNTLLNRLGLTKSGLPSSSEDNNPASAKDAQHGRPTKKLRKMRVAFRDQLGGELVEVVGFSDGADVGTEPGPIGVKEGSLVGKYESLVQTTIIPKGKEQSSLRGDNICPKGVTGKLQEILNRVKNPSKSGIYDDLYGESFSGNVGSSWAYSSSGTANKPSSPPKVSIGKASTENHEENNRANINDSDDDLFGN